MTLSFTKYSGLLCAMGAIVGANQDENTTHLSKSDNHTSNELLKSISPIVLNEIDHLNQKFPSLRFGLTSVSSESFDSAKPLMEDAVAAIPDEHLFNDPLRPGELDSFDWRTPPGGKPSCVSPLRHQLKCLSCWAIAGAGALEGHWCRSNDYKLTVLSPQSILDCDKGERGCNGAKSVYHPLKRLSERPVCADADYPYLDASSGKCQMIEKGCKVDTMAKSNGAVLLGLPTAGLVRSIIATRGPVAAMIATRTYAPLFRHYKSGYVTAQMCADAVPDETDRLFAQQDHAVLLVGYKVLTPPGEDQPRTFFLVKNSYGEQWGDKGYMWLELGGCGLGTNLAYPDVMPGDLPFLRAEIKKWAEQQQNAVLFGDFSDAKAVEDEKELRF